jgi:replicative DNA helicase
MMKNNLSKEEQKFVWIALTWIKQKKLFIFDKSYTVEQIFIKADKIKQKHSLSRVFVDHLGLIIKPKGNNNNEKIGHISNSLKRYAKELDVPLFALSQLSRNVETRGSSKRPMLSDLRDSGEIEQDADIVIFPYRPEYYKIDTWDDDEQTPTRNTMEIIFAKNRNGSVGQERVNCFISTQRIGTNSYYQFEEFGQQILNYKADIKEPTFVELPKINPTEAFDDVPY